MPSENEKIEITENLLKSKLFRKSPTSSSLLRYLVKATINGVDLKESTIGLEFFGKKYISEKDNAHVRVNVFNLRKKLQKYYQEEGKSDKWKIIIEKGQYQTRIVANSDFDKISRTKFYKRILILFIVFMVCMGTVLKSIFPLKPQVWKSILSNDKRTTLFIGDVIGIIGETATGNYGLTRDFKINSPDDFYAFVEKRPELKNKLELAPYTYLTRMGPYATLALSKLFHRYNADFEIRLNSNSSYADIIEGNSIYVGPFKNNNKFMDLFNEANHEFNLDKGYLHYSSSDTKYDTTFNLKIEGARSEYALVCRLPGPNKTEQFLFFSDHDIGVQATIDYFTQQITLKEFARENANLYKGYFTALYLVKGRKRTNIKLEEIMVVKI